MFGFHLKAMESTGSADRFPIRIDKFRKAEKRFPILQHYFWWVMHNCVTHFLIGLVPIKPFFQFHDWTSVQLNAGEEALSSPMEDLEYCKLQAEKLLAKLRELNKKEEDEYREPNSIVYVEELIHNLDYDILYNKNKGMNGTRKLRKATRIIFNEK